LYHTYAAREPIFDYHCHLPVKDIAENRRFNNLFEIWLEGDHYKWRAMRANGVSEKYCLGDADPYEKYLAWARTVPCTLRNPLYHWTHLELKRYFGINQFLDETTAAEIWERASVVLKEDDLSAQGILRRFCVAAVCTTDDPTDSLDEHKQIAASNLATRVFPTFRPDKAMQTQDPVAFNSWVDRLAARANVEISRMDHFLDALHKRHEYFHQRGCRASDHGMDQCHATFCTQAEVELIFDKLRAKQTITPWESEQFGTFLMLFFGHLDASKGWVKQLHLGAYRNVNAAMFQKYGRDTGFDSIGDWTHARALGAYLDRLEQEGALPKMILYNLNPADNYVFATMTGNFQDGSTPGKIQFGGGWWFLDQKEAMEWQLNTLSNTGLLSRFVGMVTDSRSFMSYPRHEYFRRVLCNLLGSEVESGLLPDDEELVGGMVRKICFANAADYLGLERVGADQVPRAVAKKESGLESRKLSGVG
jgi:glucuronate isomerase